MVNIVEKDATYSGEQVCHILHSGCKSCYAGDTRRYRVQKLITSSHGYVLNICQVSSPLDSI